MLLTQLTLEKIRAVLLSIIDVKFVMQSSMLKEVNSSLATLVSKVETLIAHEYRPTDSR